MYGNNEAGIATARDGYNVEAFAYHAFHTGSATSRTRAEAVMTRSLSRMSTWLSFEGLQGAYGTWSIFGYIPP